MDPKVTVQDLLMMIGQKEVELALLRQRIAELEKKSEQPKE